MNEILDYNFRFGRYSIPIFVCSFIRLTAQLSFIMQVVIICMWIVMYEFTRPVLYEGRFAPS